MLIGKPFLPLPLGDDQATIIRRSGDDHPTIIRRSSE